MLSKQSKTSPNWSIMGENKSLKTLPYGKPYFIFSIQLFFWGHFQNSFRFDKKIASKSWHVFLTTWPKCRHELTSQSTTSDFVKRLTKVVITLKKSIYWKNCLKLGVNWKNEFYKHKNNFITFFLPLHRVFVREFQKW